MSKTFQLVPHFKYTDVKYFFENLVCIPDKTQEYELSVKRPNKAKMHN